jgi:hypothetical protein
MAGTRKAPAKKAEERIVHAESINLEISRVGDRWFVTSKKDPDVSHREIDVSEAAGIVTRRYGAFVHHAGLKGGEEFDDLVDGF